MAATPAFQRSRAARYAARKALLRWSAAMRAHLFALATRGFNCRRASWEWGRSAGRCLSTPARPRILRPLARRSSRADASIARMRSSSSARHSSRRRCLNAGGRSTRRVSHSGISPSLRKKREGRRAAMGRSLRYANSDEAPGQW